MQEEHITDKIKESINIILNSDIDYEFRTTVLKSQLTYSDFEKIAILIKGAKKYYLQKFEATSAINDETLKNETSYSDEEFKEIICILKKHINICEIR